MFGVSLEFSWILRGSCALLSGQLAAAGSGKDLLVSIGLWDGRVTEYP